MQTITEIDHQAEALRAEIYGHDLGCFEWIAEEICEDAQKAGIAYEAGSFSETIGGATVLTQIIERLATGQAECRCEGRDEHED